MRGHKVHASSVWLSVLHSVLSEETKKRRAIAGVARLNAMRYLDEMQAQRGSIFDCLSWKVFGKHSKLLAVKNKQRLLRSN